jgi:hypothetical protein
MQSIVGWAKRVALALGLLAALYIVTAHFADRERITLGASKDSWTFGASPGEGAGAETCTYFNTPPPVFTSTQLGQVRCSANQYLMVFDTWANNRAIITSGAAVPCTSISNSPGTLVEVINALASVQGQTIDLFDDAGTTCATSARIYEVILSSSASPILMIPLTNGLAYTTTGAISTNIVVTYQK